MANHPALLVLELPRASHSVIPRPQDYAGGFGMDLPPSIKTAWLHALADKPPRGFWQRLFDRIPLEGIELEWEMAVRRWYGQGQISLQDSHLETVNDFLHALKAEWYYPKLQLSSLRFEVNRPMAVDFPRGNAKLGWRHYGFARNIIGDRLPHLRTEEMLRVSDVWNTIRHLFQDYYLLRTRRELEDLSPRKRYQEEVAFALAIYEQVLCLWHDRNQELAAYREAISQRPIRTSDDAVILGFDALEVNPQALAVAQAHRVAEYTSLLRWLTRQLAEYLKESDQFLYGH